MVSGLTFDCTVPLKASFEILCGINHHYRRRSHLHRTEFFEQGVAIRNLTIFFNKQVTAQNVVVRDASVFVVSVLFRWFIPFPAACLLTPHSRCHHTSTPDRKWSLLCEWFPPGGFFPIKMTGVLVVPFRG